MSRTPFILALLLGVGLSATLAQEVREKSGTRSTEKSPAGRSAAQTSPAPTAASSPAPGSLPSPSPERSRTDSRVRQSEPTGRFAESLLRQYDKNKNGVLDKDEWSQMQSRWHEADRNGDGTITLDEMIAHMAQLARRGSERANSLAAPSSPPAVRALPPVSRERPTFAGGEMPQPVRAFPPSNTTFARPAPSGDRSGTPERPIDPRAPLVSVQLVMVEVVADAAGKTGSEPQPPASSNLAKGPATLPFDLSGPSEKILEELRKLGMRGRLDVIYQVQLTTVDLQSASFQFGQSQPQITGVTLTQFGQSNSVQIMRTGLIVEIHPRVAGNMVWMEVDLQESRLGRSEEGVPISVPAKGETIRVAPTHQRTLKTTVRAPSGQTIVLSGMTEDDGPRKRQLAVLVCPRIIPLNPSETTRPAR